MDRNDTHIKTSATETICIGILTPEHDDDFEAILSSYQRLVLPAHVELVYCIVENAPRTSFSQQVHRFAAQVGHDRVFYICEPKPGMDHARNTLLDFALMTECDMLTLVDRNARVDLRWLIHMQGVMRQGKLDLVGGPVRLQVPPTMTTRLQTLMAEGLKRKLARREKTALKRWYQNRDADVVLNPSNMMLKLSFMAENELRFAKGAGALEAPANQFYRAAKEAGAATGWAPRAVALHMVAQAELSVRHQFCKARDRALTRYTAPRTWPTWLCAGCAPLARALASVVLLVALPFAPAEAMLACIQNLGISFGMVQGMFRG